MKFATDKACAGCNTGELLPYPPIKIPTGEIDMSRYPALSVEYNNYCYECALAILIFDLPVGVSVKLTTDKFAERREALGLNKINTEVLEKIYEQLPRPKRS